MSSTLYTILDVARDADQAAIAQAYAARLSAREGAPDRATLTYAYLVLSDPERRAAYDLALEQAVKRNEGDEEVY